jgi:hypothetical protein
MRLLEKMKGGKWEVVVVKKKRRRERGDERRTQVATCMYEHSRMICGIEKLCLKKMMLFL